MRVLVLVGSAGLEPWRSIEAKGQEATFASLRRENVDIVWMESDPVLDESWAFKKLDQFAEGCFNNFRVVYNLRNPGQILQAIASSVFNITVRLALGRRQPTDPTDLAAKRVVFPFPSLYSLSPIRLVAYLRYALANFQFDYLLRVTSTCYVDVDQLLRVLEDSPRSHLYAGEIYSKRKVPFIGGAAILFSRDVVEGLVANEKLMRFDVHDDVAFGELIDRFGIAPLTQISRVDVKGKSMSDVIEAWLSPARPFIFRCKASDTWTDSSQPVIDMMHTVHRAIEQEKAAGSSGASQAPIGPDPL